MDSIKTEGDLDALRRQASAWAVIIAWAQTGLFDLLKDGEPVIAEELPIHGNALRNTAPCPTVFGPYRSRPRPRRPSFEECVARSDERGWWLARSLLANTAPRPSAAPLDPCRLAHSLREDRAPAPPSHRATEREGL